MFELVKLITAMILPPFNIILLWLLALILFAIGYKYSAYFFALLGIVILYIFSIPYTSQKLGDSLLEGEEPTIEKYKTAQAIVVLGGGLRDSQELFGKLAIPGIPLERMRYAAYLHKKTGLPILATGSSPNGTSEAKIIADEFKMFFNIDTKWLENKAKTTKENAIFSREILEKENINKIVLVTNQWHMKRAEMLFKQQGFDVLPASVGSGDTPDHYKLNFMHFVPQAGAMNSNMLALKEWIGYWKESK